MPLLTIRNTKITDVYTHQLVCLRVRLLTCTPTDVYTHIHLRWIVNRPTAWTTSRLRSAAAVGNWRRKTAQIDQNANRSPLASNWSRPIASALMWAATRRRWTQARSCLVVISSRQLVATGRNSRTRSTLRNSTPTRRRSVAVRRQSAHVASDATTDRSASVAARRR